MINTDIEIKKREDGNGFDINMEFSVVDPVSFFDVLEMKRIKKISDETKNETVGTARNI